MIPQDSRSLCGWSKEKTGDLSEKKEFNSSSYNRFISYQSKNLIFILILFYVAFNI